MSSMYSTVERCHTRKDTRKVLRYVNRIRAEVGLRPLLYLAKGEVGNAMKCSIAASLTTKYTVAEVSTETINVYRKARLRHNTPGNVVQTVTRHPLPKFMSEWIERFDSHIMPGLVKQGTEKK